MRTRKAKRKIAGAAGRLARAASRRARSVRDKAHGFVIGFVRGRWCSGAYDVYVATMKVVSQGVTLWAPRIQALPARFHALLLLRKAARTREQDEGIPPAAPDMRQAQDRTPYVERDR